MAFMLTSQWIVWWKKQGEMIRRINNGWREQKLRSGKLLKVLIFINYNLFLFVSQTSKFGCILDFKIIICMFILYFQIWVEKTKWKYWLTLSPSDYHRVSLHLLHQGGWACLSFCFLIWTQPNTYIHTLLAALGSSAIRIHLFSQPSFILPHFCLFLLPFLSLSIAFQVKLLA